MSDGKVEIETGFGPITIPLSQLDLWNKYGWPTEDVLQKMAAAQAEHGDANWSAP